MENMPMTPKRMLNRAKPLPDPRVLLEAAYEFFQYHPDGFLTYRKDPRHPSCATSKVVGKRVGGDDGHGYLMCMLLGHKFKVHQVVWLLHHGALATLPIDHADRDRRNNRIGNLRMASDLENVQNIKASTTPTAGVWRSPKSGRYMARVTYRGNKRYLGYYDTSEEANAAYRAAKASIAGTFSPVN